MAFPYSRSLLMLAVVALSCTEDKAKVPDGEANADSNESSSPRAKIEELMGGNILVGDEVLRSGFATVGSSAGQCTASILYTSGFRRRTWVITASHCFDGAVGSVSLLSPTGSTLLTGGTFIQGGSPATWPAFDVALVFFPAGLPVMNNVGLTLNEFFRPVWSTDPSVSSPVAFAGFGTGTNDQPSCNQNTPRTNDTTLRWASATFDNAAVTGNIGTLDPLSPSMSYFLFGDSGGPWVTASSMTTNNLIDNGVIAGVLAYMGCAGGGPPNAYEASSTFYSQNMTFLSSNMGSDLTTVSTAGWTRACFRNWCAYDSTQKAAVLASLDL